MPARGARPNGQVARRLADQPDSVQFGRADCHGRRRLEEREDDALLRGGCRSTSPCPLEDAVATTGGNRRVSLRRRRARHHPLKAEMAAILSQTKRYWRYSGSSACGATTLSSSSSRSIIRSTPIGVARTMGPAGRRQPAQAPARRADRRRPRTCGGRIRSSPRSPRRRSERRCPEIGPFWGAVRRHPATRRPRGVRFLIHPLPRSALTHEPELIYQCSVSTRSAGLDDASAQLGRLLLWRRESVDRDACSSMPRPGRNGSLSEISAQTWGGLARPSGRHKRLGSDRAGLGAV